MRGAVDQWGAVAAWRSNQPCHPSRVLRGGDQWGELDLLPSWWWWGEGWRAGPRTAPAGGQHRLGWVPPYPFPPPSGGVEKGESWGWLAAWRELEVGLLPTNVGC